MKAVILAAGKGTRLHPITLSRPKHLIPIGGRPIIEQALSTLKNAGIKEVIIVVNYLAEVFKQRVGDGTKFGMEISFVVQKELKGTADATGCVESFTEEPFLLTYGDWLTTSKAITRVLKTHEEKQPTITMAVVPVDNPEHYGIVQLENSWVKSIIEKPPRNEAVSNLANAGVYVLSTKIFEAIKRTKPSQRGELEITDSLSLLLREGSSIAAASLERSETLDVGLLWDLLPANAWVLQKIKSKTQGQIENGTNLIGPIIVEEGARIRSGAYIEGPAFIGRNSDIGPNCFIRPHTSIGQEVRIGNACEIKNSIVMDRTHIGHLSYVGDSVVGENCNLGAGTTIANYRFDGKSIKMKVKNEIVDTGKRKLGVVMGDNVKTGINSSLMPGIRVGQDCWIGPEVLIRRDVPSKTKILLRHGVKTERLTK
ncbi:MAG: sugar phosphate nucleotidyltransferase [Candidatus Bathyarchaeota archaeon]|nr:sugar phosphate nucleotidyltransferase [Candidatus Bathyarchaeota archaeon]